MNLFRFIQINFFSRPGNLSFKFPPTFRFLMSNLMFYFCPGSYQMHSCGIVQFSPAERDVSSAISGKVQDRCLTAPATASNRMQDVLSELQKVQLSVSGVWGEPIITLFLCLRVMESSRHVRWGHSRNCCFKWNKLPEVTDYPNM